MYLTAEEKTILSGQKGEAAKLAMETLVKIGELNGAEKFVPIKNVHLVLHAYKSAFDAGVEIAEKIAIKYGAKNVFDYLELTPDIAIYEIKIPESWLNKTIIEKAVRTRYHVSILATKKNGRIFPLPPTNHVFAADETLIVMGTAKSIKEITR